MESQLKVICSFFLGSNGVLNLQKRFDTVVSYQIHAKKRMRQEMPRENHDTNLHQDSFIIQSFRA
jgi:hypothetical protein